MGEKEWADQGDGGRSKLWNDVKWLCKKGKLMEAILALELHAHLEDYDWSDLAEAVEYDQPELAQRLASLRYGSAYNQDLIRTLGNLSKPFARIKTFQNTF